MRSRPFRPFVALFVAGALVAMCDGRSTAAGPFVVHEWGTFSTFSGSDGVPLKFTPNDTDLPSFVHRRGHYVKGGVSDALVSLETPVLYFYTDRDRTVSVRAEFKGGAMTDWYPAASRPPTPLLRWDGLRVHATDRPAVPEERGPRRYYEARTVDAASVTATGEDGKSQSERFLFYRSVGDAAMPVTLRAKGNGQFVAMNAGRHAVPAAFLLDVKDRTTVRVRATGALAAGSQIDLVAPDETKTADAVAADVVKALVGQGLYDKEAKAMVKTWQSDWFAEPGTRVLYFVAESATAELLPLTIDPAPDRTVRVLVGRHDVLTPEREREIEALVVRLNGDSNADAKVADGALTKTLGRYRAAAQSASEKRLSRAGR